MHGDVTANLVFLLVGQSRGKHCRARFKETKVRSGPGLQANFDVKGMFSYPDVVVICGEPTYHDNKKDVVTNPKVIIAVLSPSTESFDRGEKFDRYQSWNQTLTDYLLVSQDRARIEHFSRQSDGSWTYKRILGLDGIVPIPSIECQLKLADVYDRVEFPGANKPRNGGEVRKAEAVIHFRRRMVKIDC